MAFERGKIQTLVGTGERGYACSGGRAAGAGMDRPHGCDVDRAGNIYIADSNNHRVGLWGPNRYWVLVTTGLRDDRCQQHHGNLSHGAVLILLVQRRFLDQPVP